MFIVLRFLTGLGMGAEWGTGTTLLSEYLKPRTRGRGLAFLAGCFGVGFLVATGVWLFIDAAGGSWRWLFVLGIVPALLALYVRRRVAEPPMWEESRQARRQARDRQRQGATLDEREVALTKLTFSQCLTDPRFRGQTVKLLLLAASCLIGWWAVSTRVPAHAGVVGADLLDQSLGITYVFFLAVNGFFTLGLMGWMGIYPTEVYPTYLRATAIITCVYVVGIALSLVAGPETKNRPLPQRTETPWAPCSPPAAGSAQGR
ncbi:MAG: MFS transporter [Streptosporangiales bacterium]|nr:MFS transporter [Streptosporangiales bacterium]